MKIIGSFSIVAIVLLGLGLLAGALSSDASHSTTPDLVLGDLPQGGRLTAQHQRNRNWKKIDLEKELTLGDRNDAFFYLVTIKTDSSGAIYVLDSGDHSVKKLSAEGVELQRYGGNSGSGPGEFSEPTDFFVNELGEVWISDQVNGTLTIFSRNGRVVRTIRCKRPPNRVVLGPNGEFVTSSPFGERGIFEMSPGVDGPSSIFGRLVDEKPESRMAIDGWLARNGTEGFLYAPIYAGVLLGYGFDGKLNFATETIEPVALPKVLVDSEGTIMLDPETKPLTYSMTTSGDEILLLTRPTTEGWKNERVVDVYDQSDGRYKYSFPLSERCKGIAVAGDRLFTLTATTVTRWRMVSQDEAAAPETGSKQRSLPP